MLTKIKILESENAGEIIKVKNILHDLKIDYKVKHSEPWAKNSFSEAFSSRINTAKIRLGSVKTCIYIDKKDADVFWQIINGES